MTTDQEKKYREEFMEKCNCSELEAAFDPILSIQFPTYVAARKKAQKEIEKRDKLLENILPLIKWEAENAEFEDDLGPEKLKQWIKEVKELI